MKPHFATVKEIKKTNTLSAREETPAYHIALALLESGFHGMPIVNAEEKVVGKVSELDLIRALSYMMQLHLFRIPVVDEESHLVGTLTRHDLLRGWMGALGVTHEGYWG